VWVFGCGHTESNFANALVAKKNIRKANTPLQISHRAIFYSLGTPLGITSGGGRSFALQPCTVEKKDLAEQTLFYEAVLYHTVHERGGNLIEPRF
jgi:hypothetical protein